MKHFTTIDICVALDHRHATVNDAKACLDWQREPKQPVPDLMVSTAGLDDFRLFTFGTAHRHPVTGQDLSKRCVIWLGAWEVPRALMFQRFGNAWAMSYGPPEARVVFAKYQYSPLTAAEMPPIVEHQDRHLREWIERSLAVMDCGHRGGAPCRHCPELAP